MFRSQYHVSAFPDCLPAVVVVTAAGYEWGGNLLTADVLRFDRRVPDAKRPSQVVQREYRVRRCA